MDAAIVFLAEYLHLFMVAVAFATFIHARPHEKKKMAIAAGLILPLAYIVARIAGAIYFNPRPFLVDATLPLVPHLPDNGFPSDHTLFAASIAAVILCFRLKTGLLLVALAVLVGIGRILAGVHHVVDVIGSLVIVSAVTACIRWFVLSRLSQFRKR